MKNRFDDGNNDSSISFRDVMMGMMGLLAAIVVLLILQPREPNKATDQQQHSRGNIRVEVMWPDSYNVDIDTWGKAPNNRPVGYSNRSGLVLNLVRDDLGRFTDIGNHNYETMFSRGLPAGEWVFNVHWFSNTDKVVTVPVRVVITITKDDSYNSKSKPKQVVATNLTLNYVGQEKTVIRFKLDKNGNIVKNSMTSLFKPLRSARM